jgi:hypothetical protein
MPLPTRIRSRADRAAGAPGSVRFSAPDGDWVADADCPACGGYTLELRVFDPDERDLARDRGQAFLARVHARGCLGCQARTWRTRPSPPGPGPYVWWDTDAREWMAWGALPGSDRGVSLPLGIRTFWAPHEVRAAARALWSGNALPLRVVTNSADVGTGDSAVFHDPVSGRWRLRVACFDCGGFDLPLMSFGRGAVETAVEEALDCLELVAGEGCPHCRTLRERHGEPDAGAEPRLWYDTGAGDWLLWQGVEDVPGGVTMPLGIGRYDAPRTAVYQSAAPLLFGSELFLDEGP